MNSEHIFRDVNAALNQLDSEMFKLTAVVDDDKGHLGLAITRAIQCKSRIVKLQKLQPSAAADLKTDPTAQPAERADLPDGNDEI